MQGVLIAAVPDAGDGVRYRLLSDDGAPVEPVKAAAAPALGDLAAVERRYRPRWVFDAAAACYPRLLAGGVRIERCHDVSLTERILLGRQGRFDEPCRAPAVVARRDGRPPPADPGVAAAPGAQHALFDADGDTDDTAALLEDVSAAYRDQLARVDASAGGAAAVDAGIAVPSGALRLLIAAESGSALVAAEMTRTGLPWDAAVHERILTDTLGPRPPAGTRPARMAELAASITEAFGFPVNPDSAVDLRAAFQRAGFDIETTRAWVIRDLDHPAVAPVLAYKDLARLYTANGWNWLQDWVSDGRLVSEYLPGAVVSGRWATRGGGGLQLPKAVRSAAVARPGYVLVVADAAQLEPRVLAAVAGDRALAAVSRGADLYDGLAADGFGG
ncbi:MAG TPA: bifunctional 3'-5' exonuclease/DNA polymerase, partial [Nakamurella sp.]